MSETLLAAQQRCADLQAISGRLAHALGQPDVTNNLTALRAAALLVEIDALASRLEAAEDGLAGVDALGVKDTAPIATLAG